MAGKEAPNEQREEDRILFLGRSQRRYGNLFFDEDCRAGNKASFLVGRLGGFCL